MTITATLEIIHRPAFYLKHTIDVTFVVFTAVIMKNAVFWDVTTRDATDQQVISQKMAFYTMDARTSKETHYVSITSPTG
jgi:hypothetical protein